MRLSRAGDVVRLHLEPEEAGLLAVLGHQFADLVRDPELDDAALLARLFPDGYRDDPDAAAEFRRYTRGELEQRKIAAAEHLAGEATSGLVELDADSLAVWARSLTDLRVMVGTRLGVTGDAEPEPGPLRDIYDWLGHLQWVLVDELVGDL